LPCEHFLQGACFDGLLLDVDGSVRTAQSIERENW
jgi:hypothetical protein